MIEVDENPECLKKELSQIGRASSDNLPLLIMGDINLDTLRWSDPSLDKKLRDFANKWRSEISRTGLIGEELGIAFISNYTKNGEHIESGLDHIYHSSDDVFKNSRKIINRMSDHYPILCTLQINKPQKRHEDKFVLRRSWAKYDQNTFIHDLANQDWSKVIDPNADVHQQGKAFKEIFKETLDKHSSS